MTTNRIDIQDRVRRLQHEPREQARLEVERLRQNLTAELVVLNSLRQSQDVGVIADPVRNANDRSDEFDDLDDDAILEDQHAESVHEDTADSTPPEQRRIVFPSTHMPSNHPLRKVELKLRIKQASQYLTAVREAIAEKSFQYSHVMRVAPTKGVRTRSRAVISKINERLGYCCRMYGCARSALISLSADEQTLHKFRTLVKGDVKSSTAILDPNVPGASSQSLSWIWQTRSGSAKGTPESMLECTFD